MHESECHAKKIDLLFSRSGSLQEFIWPKYDNFYCIFLTAKPFATKLALTVHYHKPEFFMEKLDCCVQGQGHSKISKCRLVFIQISSELLNLLVLLPHLVWWCIIMSQIVFHKDWFGVCKVKVTVKDNIIKLWPFNVLSELLIFFQLNLVWWHIIRRWIVLWKDWIALSWSWSRSQHSSECSSGQYLLSCLTFCNQTLYGDATSWATVSCKKICLLSSNSGSQWGLI